MRFFHVRKLNAPVAGGNMALLYGGIEAGGTKFICAVGTDVDHIQAKIRVDTTVPEETFRRCMQFFRRAQEEFGPISALGIASFGPLNPNPHSHGYGCITTTPKKGWNNTDFMGYFHRALGVPVGFDTDVTGSALGEGRWGAAQGLRDFMYITVGTGIGGGIISNGRVVHGLVHPEVGHILIRKDDTKDPFPGNCPYHHDCLEGLSSGVAMQDRWKVDVSQLPSDHPAWELESDYLAQAVTSFVLLCSPERIILGGGVMKQEFLFPMIRKKVLQLLNGYVQHEAILQHIDEYIVPPKLGDLSGVSGAFVLAEQASQQG